MSGQKGCGEKDRNERLECVTKSTSSSSSPNRPTDRALHNSGYDWEIVEERKRRRDREGAEEEEEEGKQDGKPMQRTCGSRMV